jgi:DNA-binding SARP family transcriptional activator/Tfp pilus assembly protein PilF
MSLLGGFALESGDGGKLNLPTRKDRLLLAYLALKAGQPQTRERLAGLLWGDRGEAQARDSLKQALAGIRQAFRQADADPIRADRESITLEPAGIEIDALEFARLAADPATAAQAIEVYKGALLEGIDAAAPEFDDWLKPERARLGALAERALEQLAQTAAANGRADDAIQFGRRLLAADPLSEPVYRALMRLLAQRGDNTSALKLYSDCRNTLQKELGVPPDSRTEALYRDIVTDRLSPPAASATEPVTERPSAAVLPFSNLSADPALAPLCDGVTEDIITGLGRFHMLFVIDRHSSAAIAQQTADVQEIGRRLGVIHLVQGSLQRQGERVRITVRLIAAATRAQVWGEAYDIALADILAVPDKVTSAIVTTLHSRVESSLLEQTRRKPHLSAYECVLRGIKHLRSYGPDDNQRAVELFQQAMELDPDYARARAYRAFADVVLHGYADAPEKILRDAVALGQTAVELDDDDGRCHWLLGMICGYSGDLMNAELHYERAISLNPNDANALAGSGLLLAGLGRAEEGIDRIRKAMRINPYHPEWYWMDLAMALYAAQRYEEAADAFKRRKHLGYWTWWRIAACYAQIGRMEEAAVAADEARREKPDISLSNIKFHLWTGAEAEHVRCGLRKAGMPE